MFDIVKEPNCGLLGLVFTLLGGIKSRIDMGLALPHSVTDSGSRNQGNIHYTKRRMEYDTWRGGKSTSPRGLGHIGPPGFSVKYWLRPHLFAN